MKRGGFFATDAFLASMIIVLGIVISSTFFITDAETTKISYLSHDMINTLSWVKVKNIENEYIVTLRSKGLLDETKEEYSILEYIARLYVENNSKEAVEFLENLTGELIPPGISFEFSIDGQLIHGTAPAAYVSPYESALLLYHLEGNANDASGNNLDGTISGATFTPLGKIDGAYSFDGDRDLISAKNSPLLDFGSDSDFTVAAWIKNEQTENAGYIMAKEKTGKGFIVKRSESGRLYSQISDGIKTVQSVDDGPIINQDVWHHIAVTFDREGLMTRYVDGSPAGSTNDISAVENIENTNKFEVSDRSVTWNGIVDEVAVWDRVLSPEEINDLHKMKMEEEVSTEIPGSNVVAARRMVTGLALQKPLEGFTARAFLSGSAIKEETWYEVFGGRTGYGNISRILSGFPSDAVITDSVVVAYPFAQSTWYVNGNECLVVNPSGSPYVPSVASLSSCVPFFGQGDDVISVDFKKGNLSEKFMMGAVIRINYTTESVIDPNVGDTKRVYLDGIDGFIDEHTGIIAKGVVNSIWMNLSWRNWGANWDYDKDGVVDPQPILFFRIGNVSVWNSTKSAPYGFELPWAKIGSYFHGELDSQTIPIYIGYNNVTPGRVRGGFGDLILATETSSSVNFLPQNDTVFGQEIGCNSAVENPLLGPRRLSYMKCGLQNIVLGYLGNEKNRIGLIEFDGSVSGASQVNLTTNGSVLASVIGYDEFGSGYDASEDDNSCICCAINAARDMLTENMQKQVVISSGSAWNYVTSKPSLDAMGLNWLHPLYDDSSWTSGNAIFGSNYQSGNPIVTDWATKLSNLFHFKLSIPEMAADAGTPVVEFTSGFYAVNNSFGPSGANDGWDSQCMYFTPSTPCGPAHGYNPATGGILPNESAYLFENYDLNHDGVFNDSVVDYAKMVEIVFGNPFIEYLGLEQGSLITPSDMLSSAFGVNFNINQTHLDVLNANGWATLKLKIRLGVSLESIWETFGIPLNESYEAAWVKGMLGNQISGMTYLGEDLDGSGIAKDSSKELFWCQGFEYYGHEFGCPGASTYSGFIPYEVNVSSIIQGGVPGDYYLILGAIVNNTITYTSQYGMNMSTYHLFDFDDISITVANESEEFYVRKTFSWSDTSPFEAQMGLANILSDDFATVWLNGHEIDEDIFPHADTYWNRQGKIAKGFWVENGTNVISAKVTNEEGQSKFDLEFSLFDTLRQRDILLSVDEGATATCEEQDTGDATSDAVKAACDAFGDWGIRTHVIGTSLFSDRDLATSITDCSGGFDAFWIEGTSLVDTYTTLALSLLSDVENFKDWENIGALIWEKSVLLPSSYIEINVTPDVPSLNVGELSLVKEMATFVGCGASSSLPNKVRLIESEAIIPPGPAWTEYLDVNSNLMYNIANWWSSEGTGSPGRIYAPGINIGNNGLQVNLDADPNTPGGGQLCPGLAMHLGTFAVRASSDFSDVVPYEEGCDWQIKIDEGPMLSIPVPSNYSGSDTCDYNQAKGRVYNPNSSIQAATYDLLQGLDWDENDRIDLNIRDINVEVQTVSAKGAPYMWGPAIVEVRAWY